MSIVRINSLGITDGTIVNADINSSAAIASTKLTGVNDAKAWVNFNGTGTVAIRASFNVSSITDLGTGDYTVNFTTALADANYAFSVDSREDEGGNLAWGAYGTATRVAQTTTTFRVLYEVISNGTSYDPSAMCLIIFR